MTRPFQIGDHVTGPFFTDRADEVARIHRALRESTRLLVLGPRRMGKSSAIAVATERARAEGVVVVRADLSTASGLVEVANRLLASLSAQRSGERLAELARSLSPYVSLSYDDPTGTPRLSFGVARRRAPEEEQRRDPGLPAQRRPVAYGDPAAGRLPRGGRQRPEGLACRTRRRRSTRGAPTSAWASRCV